MGKEGRYPWAYFILGADFLSKTGIDVKYSTGTIE
jgi:hypothetical protein